MSSRVGGSYIAKSDVNAHHLPHCAKRNGYFYSKPGIPSLFHDFRHGNFFCISLYAVSRVGNGAYFPENLQKQSLVQSDLHREQVNVEGRAARFPLQGIEQCAAFKTKMLPMAGFGKPK